MMAEKRGETVKKLREAKSWSQRDLAAKAWVTGAYVAMLETGTKRKPSIAVLRRLERALGAPYGALEALVHLPQAWWRAEAERDTVDTSPLRTGPFFATREAAEEAAQRGGDSFVARYHDKPRAPI